MSDGLRSRYDAMVASGHVHSYPAQIWAITELAVRQDYLNATADKRSGLFGFFTRQETETPRGLYIWGGVGSGKSMLASRLPGILPPLEPDEIALAVSGFVEVLDTQGAAPAKSGPNRGRVLVVDDHGGLVELV